MFAKTKARCDELVLEFTPTPNSDNCNVVLVPGTTPLYPVTGTCVISINGAPPDNWDDYYTLGNVISYNSTSGVYQIDMAFFEDVLANPRWLGADSTSIGFNGSSYQFYGVTPGDIAHALGLVSGYVPVTLNGMDVTSLEGVMTAMIELRYETEFEFIVMGFSGPITLNYQIVP